MLAGGAIEAWSFLTAWWAGHGLVTDPGSLRFVSLAAWLSLWLAPLPWPLVLVAPLVLFPDGRARSRRWQWFLVVVAAVVGALVLATAILAVPAAFDRPIELLDTPDRGSAAPEWAIALSSTARTVGLVASLVALGGVLWARRRTVGLPRRQHTTVLVGALVQVTVTIVDALLWAASGQRFGLPSRWYVLVMLSIPAAITLAVVRYRLFGLGVLVSRSALVLLVGALLAALYAVVLVGLGAILDDRTVTSVPSVLAAGAVVIATAPVVTWATRATRRWFGRGADSMTFAARLSERFEPDDDAHSVLQRLVATVRAELHLGSVEMAVDGLEPGVAGRPDGPTSTVPLDYQGRRIGAITVTARPGERLAEPDYRTLEQIGPFLAVTAEAIRVNEDLRHSQLAVQNAHAEERRRVRRDLHDGVGPTLATVRLKLVAHRRRLPSGLSVDDIVEQVSDSIREVRRIVDGLQPSVLEDLGLVPALQILVADTREASGIDITIEAEPELPDVTAHVATTSYRVIAEGLANVIRHSQATTCTVHLAHADHTLRVDIHDDGCGFDTCHRRWRGACARSPPASSAAGGETSVTSSTGVGTTISVSLPT